MTPASTLEAAKSIISTPRNWTQEAIARDRFGAEVRPEAETAECFCMVGAVRRAAANDNVAAGMAIRLLRAACGCDPMGFNDAHGHKAVLKIMNRAIMLANSEPVRSARRVAA